MARTKQKIKCISYIRVGGEKVPVDSLNPEQKSYVGAWLKETTLNTLCQGKAECTAKLPPVESVFPIASIP